MKESSESCSALQAYKARAFRSGELQKERIYWYKKYSTRTQQHCPPHCVKEGPCRWCMAKRGPRTSTALQGSEVMLRGGRARKMPEEAEGSRGRAPCFHRTANPSPSPAGTPSTRARARCQAGAAPCQGSPAQLQALGGRSASGSWNWFVSLRGAITHWRAGAVRRQQELAASRCPAAHRPRSLPSPSLPERRCNHQERVLQGRIST